MKFYKNTSLEFIDDVNDYRLFECVVFYCQAIAILLYIIFCIAFYELKKCFHQKDKNDPFQKIIRNNKQDFLETENFFMSIQVIQIMNFQLAYFLQFVIDIDGNNVEQQTIPTNNYNSAGFDSVQDFLYFIHNVMLPCEIFLYLLWCVIFWRGTRYHVLFSKINIVVITIFGIFDLGVHIFIVVQAYNTFKSLNNSISFILICSLTNQAYVYYKYFSISKSIQALSQLISE